MYSGEYPKILAWKTLLDELKELNTIYNLMEQFLQAFFSNDQSYLFNFKQRIVTL